MNCQTSWPAPMQYGPTLQRAQRSRVAGAVAAAPQCSQDLVVGPLAVAATGGAGGGAAISTASETPAPSGFPFLWFRRVYHFTATVTAARTTEAATANRIEPGRSPSSSSSSPLSLAAAWSCAVVAASSLASESPARPSEFSDIFRSGLEVDLQWCGWPLATNGGGGGTYAGDAAAADTALWACKL